MKLVIAKQIEESRSPKEKPREKKVNYALRFLYKKNSPFSYLCAVCVSVSL